MKGEKKEERKEKKKEKRKKTTKERQSLLKGLKKQLEECQKQKGEYLAGWQRARADLINYKKEEVEKLEKLFAYSLENLILKILPILDNFELAEKNLPEELKRDSHATGLLQIKKQLQEFLKNQGVEEIQVMGKEFDPNTSEAIQGTNGLGVVVEEIQKGYRFKGRIIRPAKVKLVK